MTALRRKAAIVAITAVTAAGIAGCGGSKTASGGGGGKQGGEVNVTMTSFPTTWTRSSPHTVEGWEVLWNTYTPLLTYRHPRVTGTDLVPALAKEMPQISDDGKTYKLTLRPNMKYSDGSPIKASDFTFAIKRLFIGQLGWPRCSRGIVGAWTSADGKADTISRHHHDDNTGDITIARQAQRHLHKCPRPDVRRPVPQTTPLDKDATNNLPPSSGPFVILKGQRPNSL